MRHTFASALIRNNTNLKVTSVLCGHSSISITLDVYGYLLLDDTDGLADALADTMLGGSGSKMVATEASEGVSKDADLAQVVEV